MISIPVHPITNHKSLDCLLEGDHAGQGDLEESKHVLDRALFVLGYSRITASASQPTGGHSVEKLRLLEPDVLIITQLMDQGHVTP